LPRENTSHRTQRNGARERHQKKPDLSGILTSRRFTAGMHGAQVTARPGGATGTVAASRPLRLEGWREAALKGSQARRFFRHDQTAES
ncbi:TPA: hypothetical protein ACWV6C_005437, partial [Salmonella enterica subsp. enterica serovar Muenchen]